MHLELKCSVGHSERHWVVEDEREMAGDPTAVDVGYESPPDGLLGSWKR
jgi:hypothetical protein